MERKKKMHNVSNQQNKNKFIQKKLDGIIEIKKIQKEKNDELHPKVENKSLEYFWNGDMDYSQISYNFKPDIRNPEYKFISDTSAFEFFGNQGSIHLQEVYYYIRKSLENIIEDDELK